MGLDMYLRGEKFHWNDFNNPENERKEDGFKVQTVEVDLGYWRKHPNLHGYIVNKFAKGRDECQRIELNEAALIDIIDAVQAEILPLTEGFFFGVSDNSEEQVAYDVKILEAALDWLRGSDKRPVETKPATDMPKLMEGLGQFGMTALAVKPVETGKVGQSVTRAVYYQASW